jgi:hypothetical protein
MRRFVPPMMLFWMASGAAPAAPEKGLQVTGVHADGTGVTLDLADRAQLRIALIDAKLFNAFSIDSVTLDDSNQVGRDSFVLIDVKGPSRSPDAAMHYCGAGTEEALVWLKLDDFGAVTASATLLYASCFRSIEDSVPEWGGPKHAQLRVHVADFHENTQRDALYDRERPENGLQITSKAMPPVHQP